VFEIQHVHGHHLFGRPLLRRYANGLATDEVCDVVIKNNKWNG